MRERDKDEQTGTPQDAGTGPSEAELDPAKQGSSASDDDERSDAG
jgi:hypothetical protein